MKRNWRSRTQVDVGDDGVVSLAGARLLTTTARVLGLDRGLSKRLAAWTPAGAMHDTGKVILDLAVALAVGGDCPADVAVLRGQPRLFGAVASDPTRSRTRSGGHHYLPRTRTHAAPSPTRTEITPVKVSRLLQHPG